MVNMTAIKKTIITLHPNTYNMKTKLFLLTISLGFIFTSCETDMCKSCEMSFEVTNNSSLSITELNEIGVDVGYSDYDEYFAVTHESPGQYCDSSLINIENEESTEDLDGDGTADIRTFWLCL